MHSLVGIGPHVDHFLGWCETHMKAGFIIFSNVIVACPASAGRIRIAWIFDDALVCGFPVRVFWVSTMAFVTAQCAVIFVLGKLTINEDLFMRSQRLHCSASAFPFGFGGCSWFVSPGFCNFPRDLY